MTNIRDILLTSAFAHRFKISEAESYRYLHRYGAIELTHQYYDVMHTLLPAEERLLGACVYDFFIVTLQQITIYKELVQTIWTHQDNGLQSSSRKTNC